MEDSSKDNEIHNTLENEYREAFRLQDNKEYKKAFKIFKKLEEEGFNEANFNLGYMYSNGIYVEKDLHKALEYFKKLNDETTDTKELIGSACIELGYTQEGLEYFQQAVDSGSTKQLAYLGSLYDYGSYSVPVDKDKALDYYTKACKHGYRSGCMHMTKMLKEQNKYIAEHLNEYDIGYLKWFFYSFFGKK